MKKPGIPKMGMGMGIPEPGVLGAQTTTTDGNVSNLSDEVNVSEKKVDTLWS